MDEREFRKRTDAIYKAVIERLDTEDPDDIEAEMSAGVVKIRLKSGKIFVLNHQAPLREVWYAAGDRAWHFQYEASTAKWVDPRNFDELAATLSATITRAAGRAVAFALA